MPQRKSGIKELRVTKRRHSRNLDIKTALKKTVKAFLALIKEKNVAEAEKQLKIVYKKVDKAAKRDLIKKNTAARRKSRYSKLVKDLKS